MTTQARSREELRQLESDLDEFKFLIADKGALRGPEEEEGKGAEEEEEERPRP